MKKIFTLLALTIGFSMNAQMDDNSSPQQSAGTYAVAMGYSTTASGIILQQWEHTQQQVDMFLQQWEKHNSKWNSSTAMGRYTTASGDSSTAMGDNTTASDYGSLVIGQYNSSGSSVTNSAYFIYYIKHSFCDWKWCRFLKQIGCF